MRCTILNTYARMHEDIRPRECFTHRYQNRQVEVCTYDEYIFSCLTYTQTHKHVHRHVHIRHVTIYTCIYHNIHMHTYTTDLFVLSLLGKELERNLVCTYTKKYMFIHKYTVHVRVLQWSFLRVQLFCSPQEFIMAGKIIWSPRIASRSRFKRSTIDGEGKKQIVSALRVILQAEPLAAGYRAGTPKARCTHTHTRAHDTRSWHELW